MEIHEALLLLDTSDDAKWTGDGLPRVEFVSELVGRDLSRQEITDAAPHFSRENAVVEKAGVVAAADAEVKKADIEIQEAATAEEQARVKKQAGAIRRAEALKEKAKHGDPDHVANQKRIKAWQKQQQENRRKAAELRAKMGAPGDARAPIDQAYARPNRRPGT
jgi:hypothetical protein